MQKSNSIRVKLKLLYSAWMKMVFALSWINTRIALIIVFYLCITPMAVIAKLFGADLLDKRIDKARQSYWLAKEKNEEPAMNYERQF
jgi:hypothetical protein